MRQIAIFLYSKIIFLFAIPFLLSTLSSRAQQTNISDYVLFGGTFQVITGQSACSFPGYAVQMGSSTKITGGYIGSYQLVKSTGTISVDGSIFSGGTVQLANSNIISGKIAAANSTSIAGTILSAGNGSNFVGNIDAKGNIVIGGGTVSGIVTHTAGTTYTGPFIGSRNITGNPALPVLPPMPAITNFPAYQDMADISTTKTISPGMYDDVKLSGNQTLTFGGTGVYVFDKIENKGGTNYFIFDFKNATVGTFKIYVHNNVILDKINVRMINGGSASRIFTEVHGTAARCFTISNGLSRSQESRWLGTVWAPYAAINIGSGSGNSNITGALWSGTQVNIESGVNIIYVPFVECNTPNINAGPDRALDFANQTTLTATSTTNGIAFSWQAVDGGIITSASNLATINVSAAGKYIVTASSGAGCLATDTVIVTGKLNNLIGSELSSIAQNFDGTAPPSPFFLIQNDSIVIDIITKDGQYATALAKYKAAPFGLTNTDVFSNGASNFIITGSFQISKLPLLNNETALIVYVRPHYKGFSNNGLVSSAGDTAMRANLIREGYQLSGEGVKIGVISNSYNTILAGTTTPFKTNTAAQDVLAGDLPGIGNPNNILTPVTVLKDYPFKSTDEGRAMLQIVHDVAPKAALYFRTGFLSAGDFAVGIQELKDAGCNIIVDDVTYPTEPFLKDGVIANAVDAVTAGGTTYFSSAGNFANKSYENVFNRVVAGGVTGSAHSFGGGDTLQSVTLQPGNYTIVLQWEDNIYSLGQTLGTKNDLDIYLTPDGKSLFGFNRDNTNGDPIEILPFTIAGVVNTNILIRNNTVGSNPGRFKYIVFHGDISINEYQSGGSTITGQANAAGAIAVGAARYNKTDSVESFSSVGGTFVNGIQRLKPEIVAPQGVNTTVNLGPDYPSTALDGYSNFFGTSASAPHAAAVAALIMEGRNKYLKAPNTITPVTTSPAQIKSILQSTATDMYPTVSPGFDLLSGAGFINADKALRTFATPDPSLIKLIVPPTANPGAQPFTLSVTGVNISPTSVIKFRDSTLITTFINSVSATAVVPAFNGDPTISVYTPPISSSGSDGGTSDSLKFFNLPKKNITIIADNKNKKFAQDLPLLTATILIENDTLKNTTVTLTDLGLADLTVTTLANSHSSVGTYTITPSRIFDAKNPVDVGLKELYNYTFKSGSITIDKLPLTVTANNSTITYGQKIPDIQFSYEFDPQNISDATELLTTIESEHQNQLAKDLEFHDVLGLVNGKAVTIVNGKAVPIVNGVDEAAIINGKAVTIVNGKAVPIVNGKAVTIVNGKAVTIVNNLTEAETQNLSFLVTTPALQNAREIINKTDNGIVTGTTKVVDITQESITDFNDNSAQTYLLTSVSDVTPKGLIDIESIANGKAVTIVNGDESTEIVNGKAVTIVNGKAVTIVNGKAVTIVNGEAVTIVNGKAVTIVNGKAVPIVNNQGKTAVILDESEIGQAQSQLKSLNMLTGLDVGSQFIIPGSFQNDNFEITHKVGALSVLPATVTISPAAGISKIYGTADPIFTYTNNTGLLPDNFTGTLSRSGGENVGGYAYTPGSLSAGANYALQLADTDPLSTFVIIPKAIVIAPVANQSKVFGSTDPAFTYSVNEPLLPGNNFSGALGRVTGETVAASPYTFTAGDLSAGNNYTITLAGTNTFIITQKPITITPTAGQSKVYGANDPNFSFLNDEGLNSNQFVGALSRGAGNNVGNYSFLLGSLSAGGNYSLSLAVANTFAITPAMLLVKADDKYIFKGDPMPSFTSVVSGKQFQDNPTVTYSTNYIQGNVAGKY